MVRVWNLPLPAPVGSPYHVAVAGEKSASLTETLGNGRLEQILSKETENEVKIIK